MEYGHFKRKDRDFRDRDQRGGDGRDRGFNRDRGGFRDRERGGFRDQRGGEFRDRPDREPEESVFSKRVRAGKRRTYFFDVRKTRGNDFFITITESTRKEDGFGYKRHKIFLYKEDFNRFVASLNEVVNHVKTDLMPEFDYEEFDRRQAEWEAQNRDLEDDDDRLEDLNAPQQLEEDFEDDEQPGDKRAAQKPKEDDDMSW